MKFEFAKYTDITSLYKKHNNNLQEGDGYIKFFICLDIHDVWMVRVLEDFNEEYEKERGTYLLERNKIPKERHENLNISKAIQLIKEDDFSNWDIKEYFDLEQLIKDIDGGFGLN